MSRAVSIKIFLTKEREGDKRVWLHRQANALLKEKMGTVVSVDEVNVKETPRE